MLRAFQVLSDCPCCRVESALVELVDPSRRVGVAVESRCRLCGFRAELGETVAPAARFVRPDDVVAALARWSIEEGEPDLLLFAQANFNGRSPAQIAEAVLRRERVDTGFEVIAYLFPGAGGGGAVSSEALRPDALGEGLRRGPVPPSSPIPSVERAVEPPPAPPPVDPRTVARALVSVMLADGEIRPKERSFIEQFLQKTGQSPLRDDELRVWRPFELGPPPDPAGLLTAMRACALIDNEADGTEVRVLKEYARAWRLPLADDDLPRSGAMHTLGRIFSSWFGG